VNPRNGLIVEGVSGPIRRAATILKDPLGHFSSATGFGENNAPTQGFEKEVEELRATASLARAE